MVVVAGDELFGPDGTQALRVDAPLGDPLGGLVTGAVFAPGDQISALGQEEPAHRVAIPDAPAAPDQAPLKLAMDKAMMTGPPTNPLRLAEINAQRYVRPAPTVAPSGPTTGPIRPRPIARPITRPMPRPQTPAEPVLATDDDEQIRRAMRAGLAGREPLRRTHPVVAGFLRVIVPLVFIVLLLILVLHGSGSGGNLSDLF